MPVVNLIDACYEQLEAIKKEIKAEKQSKNQPAKTTFSEIVCLLIRNYKHAGSAK